MANGNNGTIDDTIQDELIQSRDLAEALKYFNRRKSDESLTQYEERVKNALLTKANMVYGLERSILYKVEKINGEVTLSLCGGIGALTSEEHDKALSNIANKGFVDILKDYNPKIQLDSEFNDFLRENLRFINFDEHSLIYNLVKNKQSYRGGNPSLITQSDKKLLDIMGVDNFIAITIKGAAETDDELEKVDYIIYGDRKFSGGNLEVDKSIFNGYKELFSSFMKSIEHQKIAERAISDQAADETARDLAHEFRSPLTTIGGFVGRISKYLHDPERKEYIDNCMTKVIEGVTRLEKVFDFFTSGVYNITQVELYSLFQESFDRVKADKKGKYVNNNYMLELEPGKTANADPTLASFAIDDVVRNGFNAINHAGEGILKVTFSEDNDFSYVSLHNPQAVPKHLREKFKQKGVTGGSGMGRGVGIATDYMHSFNGTLDYKIDDNLGTTVIMGFPKR